MERLRGFRHRVIRHRSRRIIIHRSRIVIVIRSALVGLCLENCELRGIGTVQIIPVGLISCQNLLQMPRRLQPYPARFDILAPFDAAGHFLLQLVHDNLCSFRTFLLSKALGSAFNPRLRFLLRHARIGTISKYRVPLYIGLDSGKGGQRFVDVETR